MSNSYFRRGSGSFRCETCARATRHTGVQSLDSRFCPHCYTLAGDENSFRDGCLIDADKPNVIASVRAVIDNGGDESHLRAHFANLIKWAESPNA